MLFGVWRSRQAARWVLLFTALRLFRFKSDSKRKPRRHLLRGFVVLLVLLVSGILLIEKCLGYLALSRFKLRMAAKGEVFEADRIWPRPSAAGAAFSNQLQHTIAQLPAGLDQYAGLISGIVLQEPGIARRGSQEPSPVLNPPREGTHSWEDLAVQIREAGPALQSLRLLLRNPPPDAGDEILLRLEGLHSPNFLSLRRGAQGLQAAAMCDLQRGDLEATKEDLLALAATTRVYSDEPTLVNFMLRVAILGLSIESAWDALQAQGWTDAQLGELQEAFQCDRLLAQMPRTLEAERASRLYELRWFSSHSYLEWVRRLHSFYHGIGHTIPDANSPQVLATRYFREWVFHPLWKFAWADKEQLEYLVNAQGELDILRAAVRTGSGHELSLKTDAFRNAYRPPAACWRFYLQDQSSEGFTLFRDKTQYPYAYFSRAWSVSMKNLTLGQMLTAAIALKRYEARYGKPPATLHALVPEFLPKVPRDFMDGQPLRYDLRSDGSYVVYSVGDDAIDDWGSTVLSVDDAPGDSTWNGPDWVWPSPPRTYRKAGNSPPFQF